MRFALWLVVASSGAAIVRPAGIVLCVNASGHVEIETGSDDCCGDDAHVAAEHTPARRCDCIDTPLLQGVARTPVGTEHLLSAWVAQPLVLFEAPCAHQVAFAATPSLSSGDRFRESTALISLRSVVLLA